MASPILDYRGKYDGPQIDEAIRRALLINDPEHIPTNVYVSVDEENWILKISLGDAEQNIFADAEVDLPLESMVVNAEYSNGNIVLKLQNGNETAPIPISALINGLVNESRTIAELDLKDDITIKELRDKLDVYTTASVDQLIEELEDTINDRLNDIDGDIDKLYTDVEQNKTDILSRLPWRYGTASANENTNKWYRLGRFETTTRNNTFNSILLVHDRKGRENGILTITIEKKNNAETDIPSAFDSEIKGEWISAETQTNSTFQKRNNFVIVAWVEDTKLICELWCKINQAWNVYYALQLVNNRMATDVSKITSNPELGWVLEVTKTPYDSYPLESDTVRVIQTSDKLAEALAKINDFGNRITVLETDLSTYTIKEVVDLLHGVASYSATISGTFTTNGPTTSETASTRIRTEAIVVKAGDVIRITNGSLYHMCGIWKDSMTTANNVRNDTSTITNDETLKIENDGYIVIAFRNAKNTTLSPSEFDGSITLYRN